LLKTSSTNGVIIEYNKFCDLFGVESAKLRMDFEHEGVPVLVLEKEHASLADIGRIKTMTPFWKELGSKNYDFWN